MFLQVFCLLLAVVAFEPMYADVCLQDASLPESCIYLSKCPHLKRGRRGHHGHRGRQGKRGVHGVNGASGLPGPQGPVGPPGPNVGNPEYAYLSDNTTQLLNFDDDVTFTTNNLITSQILHTPATAPIILNKAGSYLVTFFTRTNTPFAFSLAVNGVAIPTTKSGGDINMVSQAIIQVNAGDVLTLRYLGVPVTLDTSTSGISATMSIVSLGS